MFKYKILKRENDNLFDDFINYGCVSKEEVLYYIWEDELNILEEKAEYNREKKWNEDIAVGISANAFGDYVVIVTYEGEW